MNGNASDYTKKYTPLRIAHYELVSTREEALKKEKKWKTGFGQKRIRRLIKSGKARQAVVQEKSFHLVLLDLMMSLLTGFETLKAIRKNKSLCHIPVIIVSAKTRREDIALCARLGISGYTIKPFDSTKLLETVMQALSG